MKMRCLLALEALISSFTERERQRKQLSSVNCNAVDYTQMTTMFIIQTLSMFFSIFHMFHSVPSLLVSENVLNVYYWEHHNNNLCVSCDCITNTVTCFQLFIHLVLTICVYSKMN